MKIVKNFGGLLALSGLVMLVNSPKDWIIFGIIALIGAGMYLRIKA